MKYGMRSEYNYLMLPLLLDVEQVAQFFHWKAPELQISKFKKEPNKVVPVPTSHQESIRLLKRLLIKDLHLAETIFQYATCDKTVEQTLASLSDAVDLWEAYTSKLWHNMVLNLPNWIANQSIFYEPDGGSPGSP